MARDHEDPASNGAAAGGDGADANVPLVRRSVDARGVVTLTLDRPDAFNALSTGMLDALQRELERCAADDTTRIVVIAGAGKAFSAGHDLKEMRAAPSQAYYEALFAQCARVTRARARRRPAPHRSRAASRSTNFWILPVDVLGSGPNTIVRGTLKRAMCSRHHATRSSAAALAPGFSATNAQGVSPHFGSGRATTAASITAGWRYRHSSTSSELMFSPPEMMMSFERSLILM